LALLSYELLDIGVHYGLKGSAIVKAHPMYKKADAIINFDDKFAIVQKHSLDLYVLVGNKMEPIFN